MSDLGGRKLGLWLCSAAELFTVNMYPLGTEGHRGRGSVFLWLVAALFQSGVTGAVVVG